MNDTVSRSLLLFLLFIAVVAVDVDVVITGRLLKKFHLASRVESRAHSIDIELIVTRAFILKAWLPATRSRINYNTVVVFKGEGLRAGFAQEFTKKVALCNRDEAAVLPVLVSTNML